MNDPRHSQPGSSGRDAVLSFEVTGRQGAAVVVTVEHKEPGDMWSPAGSVSMIAPAESVLRVSGLKEAWRVRVAGDPAQVRVLPPEWLPC